MKNEGILDAATIISTNLDIYPMDDDLLVLGIPDSYAYVLLSLCVVASSISSTTTHVCN